MTLSEDVFVTQTPRGAQYSRPRDRAADAARAASRGRESDCGSRQRPPHRGEYRAHSASLWRRRRRAVSSRASTSATAKLASSFRIGGTLIGACGIDPREDAAEIGYWLGVPYWGRGFATEAVRAVIDYAFGDLEHETLHAGARVSNPASRRVLEKCAFQWTGVRLTRIRAINSAAPVDRFRLDRGLWAVAQGLGPRARAWR